MTLHDPIMTNTLQSSVLAQASAAVIAAAAMMLFSDQAKSTEVLYDIEWDEVPASEAAIVQLDLNEKWKEQSSSLFSAVAEVRQIFAHPNPLPIDKVHDLLDALTLPPTIDQLQSLSLAIRPPLSGMEKRLWDVAQLKLWQRDASLRQDNIFADGKMQNVVHNGVAISITSESTGSGEGRNQANVDNAGSKAGLLAQSVDALRLIPSERSIEPLQNLKQSKSGLLLLRSGKSPGPFSDLILDRDTGRLIAISSYDASGKLRSERIQRGWKDFGNTAFPQLICDTKYRGEKLTFFNLYAIDSLETNVEIEDIVFEVEVPAKTVVVDQRKDQRVVHRLKTDRRDLSAAVDDLNDGAPVGVVNQIPESAPRSWTIGVNIAVLSILVMLFIVRHFFKTKGT